MRIHHVSIEHFRGIERGEATFADGVVCLIGPGDSTKSTILDAIEYVLCPNWFIPLDDSDFTDTDITQQIRIDVTVGPVPEDLQSDSRFGLHLRGWSPKEKVVHDDPAEHDDDERVLTIRLQVDRDLAPEWLVVTDRSQDGVRISYRDRQRFRVSRIGANADNELSWTRGSALLRLTQDTGDADRILLNGTRELRGKCNLEDVADLSKSIAATHKGAATLGLSLPSLRVDIDPKSLRANAATLSLHNNKVPARRLGLGTRRLLAIGAQLQAIQEGAIVLIDEIEHALEPHRIKHLIRTLVNSIGNGAGQIIMTSHSPATLEELGAEPLWIVRSDEGTTRVNRVAKAAQGTVRAIPEAFLSPRVVVCEGATEVGLLRSYEELILSPKSESLALHGVLIVDGTGRAGPDRALDLQNHGYDVCGFADSDDSHGWLSFNKGLKDAGVRVLLWEGHCCTEERVVSDLPDKKSLLDLVNTALGAGVEDKSALGAINARLTPPKLSSLAEILAYDNDGALRPAISGAAVAGKWFRTISRGELLGEFLFKQVFTRMENTDFYRKLQMLEEWVLAK